MPGLTAGEMKDIVREALVMKPEGELVRLSGEELETWVPEQRHCKERLCSSGGSAGAFTGRTGGNSGEDAGVKGSPDRKTAFGISKRG